jgi:hypothetical protein
MIHIVFLFYILVQLCYVQSITSVIKYLRFITV